MSLSPVSTSLETNKDVKQTFVDFLRNIETVQKTKKEAVKRRKLEELSESISDTEEEIGFEVFIDVVEEKTVKEEEISEKIRKCEKLMRKYVDETAEMKRESNKESPNYDKVEANLVGEIGKLKSMRERIVKEKISEEVAQIAKREKGEGIAEKNEEEKDKIKKQKAREVKNAEASAKKDDRIMKQEAREVKDAAASAEKDEEKNDKIIKQKAREVKNAEASAKYDEENDKIAKQKAREVKNAEASAKKDDKIEKKVDTEMEQIKPNIENSEEILELEQIVEKLKSEKVKLETVNEALNGKVDKISKQLNEKNDRAESLAKIYEEKIKEVEMLKNQTQENIAIDKEAEEKLVIVKMAEKANSLTLQGVASARNPPCGILTPSDGGEIFEKKTRRKSAEEAKKDYSETEDMMNSSESQIQELQNSRIKLESSSNVAELSRKELEPLLKVRGKFEEALTKIEVFESTQQEFVSKENEWKNRRDRDQLRIDEMEKEIQNLSEQIELKENGKNDLEERISNVTARRDSLDITLNEIKNTLSTSQSEVEEYKEKLSALEDANEEESFSHDDLEQLKNTVTILENETDALKVDLGRLKEANKELLTENGILKEARSENQHSANEEIDELAHTIQDLQEQLQNVQVQPASLQSSKSNVDQELEIQKVQQQLDLVLVVAGMSAKPREGIGVSRDSAMAHTPSSIKLDQINMYLIHYVPQLNLDDKDMLYGDKTDTEYVQVLIIIDARGNMNVSASNHEQFAFGQIKTPCVEQVEEVRGAVKGDCSSSGLDFNSAVRPRTASAQLAHSSLVGGGVHGRGAQVGRLEAGPQCGGHPAKD